MDANWWKMYSKSSCEYGVMVMESKHSKDTNIKRHISMPLHLGMGLGFQF